MATVIRLRRGGRTHSPYYRIVVQDSRSRNRGPEKAILGVYHPCSRPAPLTEVDAKKALEWLRKGAQMSDTVRNLMSKLGVLKHFNENTDPEDPIMVMKGETFEHKGYNAAPAPAPEAEAEAPAADQEEAAAEEEAETAPEAGDEKAE